MNEPGYGLRRRSREMVLQLLFQAEFVPGGFKSDAASDMFKRFSEDFSVESDVGEYAQTLFIGISDNLAKIDSAIQSSSAHWKVGRMGLVDLSVMRIAVFEMKFLTPGLGPKIAIDEAIELAKKFGSTESGAFVNGILDQVSRANFIK